MRSTSQVTRQRPAEVRAELASGKSIEAIALSAGKSLTDVLSHYDAALRLRMARAVASGRLPQSVADARLAWFTQSARLQIDQPGLDPAFPGLHELHVLVIGSAVEVSGIPRAEIRAQLETCKTLVDVVATKGKSGGDIAAAAIQHLDAFLARNVASGKLSTAQRDEWRIALEQAVTKMATTPGLHVAGKECAP